MFNSTTEKILKIIAAVTAICGILTFCFTYIIPLFIANKAIVPTASPSVNNPMATSSQTVTNNKNNTPEHTHKKYQTRKENIVKAKCTKKGSYDSVIYCKCGYVLRIKTISTKALNHKYKEGICIRCNHKDPSYVKVYNSKEIMNILSKSIVSNSGTYEEYLDSDSISVFADEKHNCFSINTAVSYNLWGGNVQTVVFNVSKLRKLGMLKFKIGGETGSSGSIKIEFFINKTFDKKANNKYEFDASSIPINVSVNIKKAKSLGIRVTNLSNNQNKIVFYGFSDEKKKNK